MDAWLPILRGFGVALAIGLVIGIERERSHPQNAQALGARSITLIALLGALAATLQQIAFQILIGFFVFASILLGYFRSSARPSQRGLTTELAAGIVFILGFGALLAPLPSAILGLITLSLLLGREQIHRFARVELKTSEIRAFVVLLILVVGLVPSLPDQNTGPYELFNPKRFVIIICLISAIEFGGYIANRLFGPRLASTLTGFFGGLVSSTLVYMVSSRSSVDSKMRASPHLASCLMSHAASQLFLSFLIASNRFDLASRLGPLLITNIGTAAGIALFLQFRSHSSNSSALTPHQNPLDLKKSIKLSAMLFGMLMTIGLAKEFLGSQVVHLLSFLGGLFELHSVSLANINLLQLEKISSVDASVAISLAILGSIVSKIFIVAFFSRGEFRKKSLLSLGLLLILSLAIVV